MIPKWTGKKWSLGCFFLRIHWFRVGLLLGLGCVALVTSRRTVEQRIEALSRRLKTQPVKAEIGSDDKSLSHVSYSRDIIRQSLKWGINDLRSNRFAEAEWFILQVLRLDPENQTALRLMETSIEGRHVYEGCPGGEGPCNTCDLPKNQESPIPSLSGPIVYPDADQWDFYQHRIGGVAPPDCQSPDCRTLIDKRKINFQAGDLALEDVLGILWDLTDIETELSPLIDGENLRISVHWDGVVLRDILEDLCDEAGLSMIVETEKVIFIPRRTPWQ